MMQARLASVGKGEGTKDMKEEGKNFFVFDKHGGQAY